MEYILSYIIAILIFIGFPILLPGIIRSVRARAQGRKGPSILQAFYDASRSFKKESLYSNEAGFFSPIVPYVSVFASLLLWSLVMFEWSSPVLIPFLLGLSRLCILLFAMEGGNSFGGLGTSREILLSLSGEPILFIVILFAGSHLQLQLSFEVMIAGFLFIIASFVLIFAETAKPPFDDPRTHLELTMVHEAMILEASGRSLSLFDISASIKLSALLIFVVNLGIEHSNIKDMGMIWHYGILGISGLLLSVGIGIWEASRMRRKWKWNPEIMGLTFIFILLLGTLIKLR
ncbi:MAG: NADH-quinone oxidoreductase subunit H [Leptospiraceae bacterium]|nr:NADH-quinone oxidoreductase subunit H [Leptospiraceae bacterium]MCP5500091.1 NADH-quinone oxidoreductase subunit H [Leptospiraceae bacterium]